MGIDLGEAADLIAVAEGRLLALQESERKPGSAVPRAVMSCGDAERILSALITMLVQCYPEIADERVADMAESNVRVRH